MKPSIILYKTLTDNLIDRLKQRVNIIQVPDLSPDTLKKHADDFARAEGLLGSGGKVDSALLENMPALRAVSTISVGYNNFDVNALTERGIALMHTPTVLTDTVADTLMALVLSTARRINEVAERVKRGEWTHSIGPDWFGVDVHHKTLGIIGMGRIGMALAQRAHCGFSMPVLYHARSQHAQAEERFNARRCNLNTLLSEADFVCLILPLSAETHHMIGAEQLAAMKPTAIFINAARGQIVDEQALINALREKRIRAAGLDVFEQEPIDPQSPLLQMPNVVATPHIGSATAETRDAMAHNAVDNLLAALQGNVTKNCVNPEVLSR